MSSTLYNNIDQEYNIITESNPGAITVMQKLKKNIKCPYSADINCFVNKCLLHNITGSKLWVAYKINNFNVKTMFEQIKTGDNWIIKEINKYVDNGGCSGDRAILFN